MSETNRSREGTHGGALVAGLILICVGTAFLLYNLGLIELEIPWRWWPLILVAIGAGKLVTAGDSDEIRGGAWMVLVGGWLLLNVQGWFGLSWHDSWPLLIVAAGLMIAWSAWSGDGGSCRRRHRGEAGGAAGAGEAGEAGGEAR